MNIPSSGDGSPTEAILHYTLGSRPAIETKVRNGRIVIGRLRLFEKFTSGLAFVTNSLFPSDVVVRGVEGRGQALHGDIVAVELLPEEEWEEEVNNNNNNNNNDHSDGSDDGESDHYYYSNNNNNKNGGGEMQRKKMPNVLPDGRPIKRWVNDNTRPKQSAAEVRLTTSLSAPENYDWGNKKPFGIVVAVLERQRSLFLVGKLVEDALGPNEEIYNDRYYQFKSFDPLMPHIAVYGRDIPASVHKEITNFFFIIRLKIRNDGDFYWTARKYPTGKIIRLLGGVDSVEANSFALCSAFNVTTTDFSDDAYACVPKDFIIPDKIELQRMGRRDLREEEFICTIDPATARDLDDALSITQTAGGYRLGVHIADVSYFVPAGSPLDEEARDRSTSVYLVEQVIPMLPRKLSEDYCSLNPGSDKFAFSSIFHLDHHGKVTSEWFGQSVIRNRCRLTYEQAQRIIDGDETVFETLDYGGETHTKELQNRVALSIKTLFELASRMRAASMERGRLSVGNMKIRFDFEDIKHPTHPLGFGISRQIEANWLVEEFMLLANGRVAEKIVEYMPDQALLRKHEPPDRKKVAILKESLERIGLNLQGSASKSFQTLLDNAKGNEFNDDICVMLKYALQAAKYYANGCEEEKAYRGHYALAMPWYTHFTSPIRRYCDIIVHRQLLCALEIESIAKDKRNPQYKMSPNSINVNQLTTKDFFYNISDIEDIVDNANVKKLNARKVSDASLGFFFCRYLNSLQRLRLQINNNLPNSIPFIPRVEVVIVRVVEKTQRFMLFSKEIAQEVEIGLKSKEQLFTPEREIEDESKEENNKNNNKRQKNSEEQISGGKLRISWGRNPKTGEDVVEELHPMLVLSAVLTTKNYKGYEELNMIIDPPWMRNGKGENFPTTLVVE